MATVSFSKRRAAYMRKQFPTMAEKFPEPTPVPTSQRRPGRLPATHYRVVYAILPYAACGTTGKYLHLTSDIDEITCEKCKARHLGEEKTCYMVS